MSDITLGEIERHKRKSGAARRRARRSAEIVREAEGSLSPRDPIVVKIVTMGDHGKFRVTDESYDRVSVAIERAQAASANRHIDSTSVVVGRTTIARFAAGVRL